MYGRHSKPIRKVTRDVQPKEMAIRDSMWTFTTTSGLVCSTILWLFLMVPRTAHAIVGGKCTPTGLWYCRCLRYTPFMSHMHASSLKMCKCYIYCTLMALCHSVLISFCVICSSGGTFIVADQTALDDIPADCQIINGNVDVFCNGDASLTNFEAFRLTEKISGYLRIESCPGLTNLSGGSTAETFYVR